MSIGLGEGGCCVEGIGPRDQSRESSGYIYILTVGPHWKYIRGCVMDDQLPVPDAMEYVCEMDGCNSANAHLPMAVFVSATPLLFGIILAYCFE